MSKNFKIKQTKKTKKAMSDKQKWIAGVSGFVVFALLCTLLVSGLGNWIDHSYSRPYQTPTATADTSAKIEFEDENLMNAIIKSQGLSSKDISEKQALAITNLTVNDPKEIKSFKGLEHFASLETLTIKNAAIFDISALADVKTLTKINFYDCDLTNATSEKDIENVTSAYFDNTVTTVSFAEKFVKLEKIELTNNKTIDNLSSLKGFNALTNLTLTSMEKLSSFEGIDEVKLLSKITVNKCNELTFKGINTSDKLDTLYIDGCIVKDSSEIAGNNTIQSLTFSNSTILSGVNALGKMNEIKTLDIGGLKFYAEDAKDDEKIFDLSILKDAVSLETLIIDGVKVKNADELAELTSLKEINLRNTDIFDISFMKNYVNIEIIDIANNDISDISVLENLKRLKSLDISYNKVNSLDALGKLKAIVTLNVSNNDGITSLEPIKNNWGLTTLKASKCSINNINIGDCTSISTLDLSGNKIEDISVLETLTKLRTLTLSNNEIKELPKFTALSSLISLYIDQNNIEDISNIASLTKLTTLDISKNEIKEIKSVEGLTSLTMLYLNGNKIEDITSLEKLTKLSSLDISENNITDIKVLEKLTDMTLLNISKNNIEDTAALSTLTKIKNLLMSDNKITKIDSIAAIDTLEVLEAANNEISELPKSLKCNQKLSRVDLSGNKLSDISVFKDFASLSNINIANNKVTDISVFATIKVLKTVDVTGNPITDYSPLDNIKDGDIKK